jgi:hypothetical protein
MVPRLLSNVGPRRTTSFVNTAFAVRLCTCRTAGSKLSDTEAALTCSVPARISTLTEKLLPRVTVVDVGETATSAA